MSLTKNLKDLKDIDLYSLNLFTLYKLTDIPEYTTISELPYILDRENMLKLCQYFGGRTIRIPTLEEIHSLMYLLLLYQYVNIDKIPYEEAIDLIGYRNKNLKKLKIAYDKLCEVLDVYSIKVREKHD